MIELLISAIGFSSENTGLKSLNIYSHHTLNPKMMSNSSGPTSMVNCIESTKVCFIFYFLPYLLLFVIVRNFFLKI
jgi:hypothetical protein